jgi:hypothetical protein
MPVHDRLSKYNNIYFVMDLSKNIFVAVFHGKRFFMPLIAFTGIIG